VSTVPSLPNGHRIEPLPTYYTTLPDILQEMPSASSLSAMTYWGTEQPTERGLERSTKRWKNIGK